MRVAEQWTRERLDLGTGPMTLLGRLAEAALVAPRDCLNPAFAEFGLQSGQFGVLAFTRRA
ncbi:hypothetical protein D3C85_1414570 [compost metagenome]